MGSSADQDMLLLLLVIPVIPESPSQSCEVQVVKYMENKQGEGMPLSESYEEVSKELRVPLGNMSRWWRNKENRAGTFLMLMLHSALLFCHPPNLAVMVYCLQV